MFKRASITDYIIYLILFLLSLIVLIPILNLLAMSFSDPLKVSQLKGLDIFPKGFSILNYQALLSNPLIIGSIFNSIFITGVGTFLKLTLTAMAAYVLARNRFVGRNAIMVFLIILMVFEPGLIPEYLLVKDIGLLNSHWSLILRKAVDVYYLFLMMRLFEDIPASLLESARIDGAGHFRTFISIMLPLSKPILATIGLFYGVYHWNEYFRATIYLSDMNKWPLQVVLRQFVISEDNSAMLSGQTALTADQLAILDYSSLQAGTIIISMIPLLLVYPYILKYFVKGGLEGGDKG